MYTIQYTIIYLLCNTQISLMDHYMVFAIMHFIIVIIIIIIII